MLLCCSVAVAQTLSITEHSHSPVEPCLALQVEHSATPLQTQSATLRAFSVTRLPTPRPTRSTSGSAMQRQTLRPTPPASSVTQQPTARQTRPLSTAMPSQILERTLSAWAETPRPTLQQTPSASTATQSPTLSQTLRVWVETPSPTLRQPRSAAVVCLVSSWSPCTYEHYCNRSRVRGNLVILMYDL